MSNFRRSILKQLLVVFFLPTLSSYAKLNTYSISEKTFSIDVDKSWQFVENLSSSPLVLLGPVKDKKRIVVSVSPTTVKDFKFDEKKIETSVSDYEQGRKKWLAKNKGQLIRFLPYSHESWKNIKEVHSIGFQYKVLGTTYFERTYFFNCVDELFNINTLFTEKQYKKSNHIVDSMLHSIDCK
ncbi:hypothetical protein [Bacteriovorax sp. Seq25_V]|uniref:hypothetical protein n=1 Tax=Bacteriovorax sp. Seq25_V TaxID=1201288 RepID=UPI0005545764|nr:hypothetical protein [Bacteriovorax sp. Seq25_V]